MALKIWCRVCFTPVRMRLLVQSESGGRAGPDSSNLAPAVLVSQAAVPVSPDSDEVLVARCRAGDRGAFELLFERHHARVFRLAVHILRDREAALDAVQETFIRAHRGLDRYSGEGSFGGWLTRIAANLAVDGLRRRQRDEVVTIEDDGRLVAEVVASGPGPQEAAEVARLRGALERGLARLSPMQRIVLVMKEIEGLSCDEIAAALRCSVGTVMSRLHYARAKMQRHLARWEGRAP
jgi:RNA polymerase sigma-70 factor (ECF subfamily)